MRKTCKYCGQEIAFVKNERSRTWVPVQIDSLSEREKGLIDTPGLALIRKKRHKVHMPYCQSNLYKLKQKLRKKKQQRRRERKRELYKYYTSELQRLESGAKSAAIEPEKKTTQINGRT
jgi:hypothetical protein